MMYSYAALASVVLFTVIARISTEPRHFEVINEKTNKTCIMMDVDLSVEFTAVKVEEEVIIRIVNLQGKDVRARGECNDEAHYLAIFFAEKTLWAIAFVLHDSDVVSMFHVVKFVPKEVFGEAVNIEETLTFSDPREQYLSNKNCSYKCDIEDVFSYVSYVPLPQEFEFSVKVNIISIQTQGFGLTGEEYGEAEECVAPVPVSPASPPLQTEVPATLIPVTVTSKPLPIVSTTFKPSPEAPVNNYKVQNEGITCIAMQSALTLYIQYAVKDSHALKTAIVQIPTSASATGNCYFSSTTQTLQIEFFKRWSLIMKFSTNNRANNKEKGSTIRPSYRISNMTLILVVDERIFPGSLKKPGTIEIVTTLSKQPNFPKVAASSDFYQCESESITTLTESVQVHTRHLKFKAFNTASTIGFGGPATVCSADKSESKSNTGLIVGIVMTIIAIASAAFIFAMLRARRKTTYENIH
ncbi:lysosome-associated membrane glycoprotein 1 [Plakobranchus ocellatus]|uniref:Lysosome-associated membrane glycoprotein 5 n=1 Tax=Plakobranchus ocellatus TaxID=259542 RepID=A0AAV3YGV3_9GAST|nr:lysosome-associated membrane glycoprotein 1 [Plakobranchus ocellatus]